MIINPYAFGSGLVSDPYNTVVGTAAPLMWWRLNETSGTSAADSSGNGYTGTLQGGATFAGSGVSVTGGSGYAGLGNGVDFSAASVDRVQSANNAALTVGTSTSSAWTMVIWMAGGGGGSQYVFNRQNDAALVYGFVSDKVEFFCTGYTGSDPRVGSQLDLSSADTTTPRMMVYRYNNTAWASFRDGVKVLDTTRSFALASGTQHWNVGAADASNPAGCRIFDVQVYNRALSDAEISLIYAARNAV